jgi:uncharacterized protein YaaR (DUF327 family)
MEKIDGTSGFLYRPDVTSREKKQEKSGKSQKSSFNGVLGKLFSRPAEGGELGPAHEIHSDEELRGLIEDIQNFGEALIKFPGVDNLSRYKQAVRDFVNHTTGHAYRAEEQLSRHNILNQKKYTIIEVIDERLDRLTRQVLASQGQQLDLLADIEEIQGLLVDILHVS